MSKIKKRMTVTVKYGADSTTRVFTFHLKVNPRKVSILRVWQRNNWNWQRNNWKTSPKILHSCFPVATGFQNSSLHQGLDSTHAVLTVTSNGHSACLSESRKKLLLGTHANRIRWKNLQNADFAMLARIHVMPPSGIRFICRCSPRKNENQNPAYGM